MKNWSVRAPLRSPQARGRAWGGEAGAEEDGAADLPVCQEPMNLCHPQLELRDHNQTFPYATTF